MEHSFEKCLLVGLWQRLSMNHLSFSILLGCNVWEQVFQTLTWFSTNLWLCCSIWEFKQFSWRVEFWIRILKKSWSICSGCFSFYCHLYYLNYPFRCLLVCSSYSFLFANMFSLSELKAWRQIGLDWPIKFVFTVQWQFLLDVPLKWKNLL